MSKGSEILKVRMPDKLLADAQVAFERARDQKDSKIETMSDWVRDCIRERLEKGARSKASKQRAKMNRQLEKDQALVRKCDTDESGDSGG